ncbi:MAG TPA: macrolide ABC transporter ATP-binding protein, partial [Gemmatimonadaceae bacterium]
VLADEPTGNLDTRRGREVLALLVEICREQQTAILLVTHDPQATGFADRVLTLRDGRIADNPPEPAFFQLRGGEVIRS